MSSQNSMRQPHLVNGPRKKISLRLTVATFIAFMTLFPQHSEAQAEKPLYMQFPWGPVEGGFGYEGRVVEDESFNYVETADGLKTALKNSGDGDTIFIPGHVTIDVDETLFINTSGITLASDRGELRSGLISPGALVRLRRSSFKNDEGYRQNVLFYVNADNVKITGLSLTTHPAVMEHPDNYKVHNFGIVVQGNESNPKVHHQLKVHNCELYGFSKAIGVAGHLNEEGGPLRGSVHADVHHNRIHRNEVARASSTDVENGLLPPSYGYGIGVSGKDASATIAYNRFGYNTHSVTTGGRRGASYTAAYNLTEGGGASNGEYDVHGFCDFNKKSFDKLSDLVEEEGNLLSGLVDEDDGNLVEMQLVAKDMNVAASRIEVVNNAALGIDVFFNTRGIPDEYALVADNEFLQNPLKEPKDPIQMRLWRKPTSHEEPTKDILGKFQKYYPYLPELQRQITAASEYWRRLRFTARNNYGISGGRFVNYVHWSGTRYSPKPLFFHVYEKGKTAVGDFNGDGVSDLFYADGSTWYVSWSGVTPWEVLAKQPYTVDQIAFGYFKKDGKTDRVTDVFRASGSNGWKVSWGGTTKWESLNPNQPYRLHQVALGDFNGDGTTDVFRTAGSKGWKVSWDGTSKWEKISDRRELLNELAFGNFDGKGGIDVIKATGEKWRICYEGKDGWYTLNNMSNPISELEFGDFNGDGKTDIFKPSGSRWHISWGGKTNWRSLGSFDLEMDQLFLGDFNGDGKTDIVEEMEF